MIAYVPYEAAFDGRLTSTAKSLLFYLGGQIKNKKRQGLWCWESLSEIADTMSDAHIHYSSKMIKDARFLLCKYGYLERHVGVFIKEVKKNGISIECEIHRVCYRVVVRLEVIATTDTA